MPYNASLALTNSQQRDEGLRNALGDFMSFFKTRKAQKDEAEKEAAIKAISTAGAAPVSSVGGQGGPAVGMDAAGMPTGITTGPAADQNAQHLAQAKAAYLMKYGQKPAGAQDFLNEDALQKEAMAGIGDSQRKRAADVKATGNLDQFSKDVEADSTLTPTEKSFYKTDPKAYGDKLKPATFTYLPTDQGYVPMPTKLAPGGVGSPSAVPLVTPGGVTPKPPSAAEKPVKWETKVDDQGNYIQTNPVTGEIRQTGAKAPTKPGAVTSSPSELADKAQQGMDLIDQMIGNKEKGTSPHPGFSSAVGAKGASSAFGLLKTPLAGTEAADFKALSDQLTGQAFLDARQQLKGGGAITDFEGKKAEGAITRMRDSQSEEGFIQAAKEYRNILNTAHERALAKEKAGAADAAIDPAKDPLGLGL